jgi:hypothetical protein
MNGGPREGAKAEDHHCPDEAVLADILRTQPDGA